MNGRINIPQGWHSVGRWRLDTVLTVDAVQGQSDVLCLD